MQNSLSKKITDFDVIANAVTSKTSRGMKVIPCDLTELKSLFIDSGGYLRPVSYKMLSSIPNNDLRYFCWKYGLYQIPTIELIDWLRNQIQGMSTIEIGSGTGAIGSALGIPITDSMMQQEQSIKELYDTMNSPVIKYPPYTIKMDANTAVDHFTPDCVIGAWVTQLWNPKLENGNAFGVDEIDICSKVKKYIFIGHDRVHGNKEVFKKFRFTKYKYDWLLSRSEKRLNYIYVYERNDI